MKSPSTTMSIMSLALWWTIFFYATTTTMACRCYAEPTLDLVLQDETISIFRGMILPQSLFSSSSKDNSFNEYTVLIQKVYQNQCHHPELVVPPFLSSSSPSSAVVVASPPPLLKAYQTITITSSKNSCGITTLPLFRTFLFSGVVSYHKQDRTRTLQEEEELQHHPTPPNTTTNTSFTFANNNSILRSPTLRRTVYTDDDDTSVFVHVNLCQYMKTWRSVTRAEKTSLSNLTPVASTATTGTDSMTLMECSGGI